MNSISKRTFYTVDMFEMPEEVQDYLREIYTPSNDSSFTVGMEHWADQTEDEKAWIDYVNEVKAAYPECTELLVEVSW